jgi:hypothetical protein
MEPCALDRVVRRALSVDVRATLWALDRMTSTWRSRTARLRRSFDENWYDTHYRLAKTGLHGFRHYLKIGTRAGYSPNAVFNEQAYLAAYPDVVGAVAIGVFRCGFEHYLVQGQSELREARPKEGLSVNTDSHLAPLFDEDWYNCQYGLESSSLRGLDHYLALGARAGYCPNASFDEKFYLAFYRDVRDAVAQRRFISGFEHYALVGRLEERMPKHRLDQALDAKFPGLTAPIGVNQADDLNARLRPLPARPALGEEAYWFLLPSFNPDIFFGGYKAAIELISALREQGKTVRVVVCADNDDGDYARHLLAGDPKLRRIFHDVPILNRRSHRQHLAICLHDKIIAYSTWEAHLAHGLAKLTAAKKFAFLIQEFEPIFHGHGAEHALTASAYDLPHYPIFNSSELTEYFQLHRLGIFGRTQMPVRGVDYAQFDHVLTPMEAPSAAAMNSRTVRRLVLYARPESHAQRNLFPIALSALRNMVRAGQFTGSWEFHGLGALKPGIVDLGNGESLILHAKMSEPEYRSFMRAIDIGVGLMYAPHPGLVAFEMASAGARVVTNTFENRTAAHLRSMSENIIPCAATITGVEEGLTVALATVDDIPSRVRGARLRREHPLPRAWSEVFDESFFQHEMAGYLGEEPGSIIEERMIA